MSGVIRSLLFAVSPMQPGVLAASLVVMMVAVAVPCHLLARRTSRIEPALVMAAE